MRARRGIQRLRIRRPTVPLLTAATIVNTVGSFSVRGSIRNRVPRTASFCVLTNWRCAAVGSGIVGPADLLRAARSVVVGVDGRLVAAVAALGTAAFNIHRQGSRDDDRTRHLQIGTVKAELRGPALSHALSQGRLAARRETKTPQRRSRREIPDQTVMRWVSGLCRD